MEKLYSDEDLLETLWERVRESSQLAVSQQLGVAPSFLNDVLHGRRDMTERVAAAMGYKREIIYRKVA